MCGQRSFLTSALGGVPREQSRALPSTRRAKRLYDARAARAWVLARDPAVSPRFGRNLRLPTWSGHSKSPESLPWFRDETGRHLLS
jgi:hypothetical protein